MKGTERRKHRRTQIQEGLSLFVVVPKSQGMNRLYIKDISAAGLCFLQEEGTFVDGEDLDLQLFVGSSFSLSLPSKIVRISTDSKEIAVSFNFPQSKAAQAIGKLQEFIELAADS